MKPSVAKAITTVVMISTASIWILWDIVVLTFGLPEATESQLLLLAGHANVFLPSATGFVLGHIWWPAKEIRGRRVRLVIAVIYGIALLIANIAQVIPSLVPIVPLLVHVPLGRLLWPQHQNLLDSDLGSGL